MTTMVEKVAQAIKEEIKRQAKDQLEWDLTVSDDWKKDLFVEAALDTQAIARAAIEAMPETTGPMRTAGDKMTPEPFDPMCKLY